MTEMRLDGSLPYRLGGGRKPPRPHHADLRQPRRRRRAYHEILSPQRARAVADYVEIWCEKDALAGIVWDVTSDYDVPLMVSRGMPSLTFLHGSRAGHLSRRRARQASPSSINSVTTIRRGVLIPQTIERRLDRDVRASRLHAAHRRARRADAAQIKRIDFRPGRPSATATPTPHGFVGDSVELDALPPRELRALVAEVIERHVSPAATATLRAAEESERELLRMWRPGAAP